MNRDQDRGGRRRGMAPEWPWPGPGGAEDFPPPGLPPEPAEPGEYEDTLRQIMRFMIRIRKTVRDGFAAATADCPRCHFPMLERLHYSIEQRGVDGAVGVSDLAAQMRSTAPAISRSLRVLESEGYIQRAADPADRRKTWVRLTPEGEAARAACEEAARVYMRGVIRRLGEENTQRMLTEWQQVEAAMLAETAALSPATAAPPPAEPLRRPDPPDPFAPCDPGIPRRPHRGGPR